MSNRGYLPANERQFSNLLTNFANSIGTHAAALGITDKLLTFDTTPGYVDSHPLPSAPAKWTYRAIYRVDDDQVGQWSKPVSVMVAA